MKMEYVKCRYCGVNDVQNPKHPLCAMCFRIIIKRKNEERYKQIFTENIIVEDVREVPRKLKGRCDKDK
jgi:hypothetical protein